MKIMIITELGALVHHALAMSRDQVIDEFFRIAGVYFPNALQCRADAEEMLITHRLIRS